MVATAKTAVNEALSLAAKDMSSEQLQLAYEKNCVVRLHILVIWEAPEVSQIPPQQHLPSAPTPPPATPTTAGAGSSPVKPPGGEGTGNGDAATPSPAGKSGGEADASDAKSAVEGSVANAAGFGKVTRQLQKTLKEAGSSGQHVSDPSHVMCQKRMHDLLANFMNATTIEELNDMVQKLKNAMAVVRQLKDGACTAATSLKSHIASRQRASQRKRAQQQKDTENQEIHAKKKQAKEAAEEIKKQEKVLPPVFNIDWADLKLDDGNSLAKHIVKKEGPSANSIDSFDVPILISNLDAIQEFGKNPKAQLVIDIDMCCTLNPTP